MLLNFFHISKKRLYIFIVEKGEMQKSIKKKKTYNSIIQNKNHNMDIESALFLAPPTLNIFLAFP